MPAVSGALELAVAHVDVVDHLADRGDAPIGDAEAPRQHLERAAVPLVGVLGLEHVEAQLARRGDVALGRARTSASRRDR